LADPGLDTYLRSHGVHRYELTAQDAIPRR
jgi:hypothetical protein